MLPFILFSFYSFDDFFCKYEGKNSKRFEYAEIKMENKCSFVKNATQN
jgi:hypothetical protein